MYDAWSSISIPSHVFAAWCLIMHRDSFTLKSELTDTNLELKILKNVPLTLVWRLATDWTVRGSYTGMGKRFYLLQVCPDRPWNPDDHPLKGYQGLFPGVKWPGLWVNYSPPSIAEFIKNGWVPAYTFVACPGTTLPLNEHYEFSSPSHNFTSLQAA